VEPPHTFLPLKFMWKWPNDEQGLQRWPLHFLTHTPQLTGAFTFYNTLVSTRATYLSDMAARPIHEHHSIGLDIVHMVNETCILISQSGWGQCYSDCSLLCDNGFGGTTSHD
jgi:hypothetical protein